MTNEQVKDGMPMVLIVGAGPTGERWPANSLAGERTLVLKRPDGYMAQTPESHRLYRRTYSQGLKRSKLLSRLQSDTFPLRYKTASAGGRHGCFRR